MSRTVDFLSDSLASKCMQEIAVRGFIKLIEYALSTMDGPLQMPHK
ncbi:unnamed protein product [Ectocarpus sp. CCAP 1310/34]|nr:unnamed protein product [Ectocarpus sp. CCAP 1310/34]